MEERQQKRLRLLSQARMPMASLHSLMQKLQENPELLSDSSKKGGRFSEAGRQNLRTVRQDLTLPTTDSSDGFTWVTASFPKALQQLTRQSEGFRHMIAQLHDSSPSSPDNQWRLVIYFDEYTPGMQLRLDNKRKAMNLSIAILDMGPRALKLEQAWVPIAVLRTNIIKKVRGGWSCCLKVMLRALLLSPTMEAGCLLNIGGRHILAFFRVSNILGDEAGLQAGWSTNGAQGLLCCLECKNCLDMRHSHFARADSSGFLTTVKEKDVTKFEANTDDDIWEKCDRLAAEGNKTQRKNLERDFGLKYNPDGLLWDLELRRHISPTKSNTHDAMHSQLSDGTLNLEIDLCLETLLQTDLWDFNSLRMLADAEWLPKQQCRTLKASMSEARERHFNSTGKMQMQASEVLVVAPFLLFFLEKHVVQRGCMIKETASLRAACKVLAHVQESKLGHVDAPATQASMYQHCVEYEAAYGERFADPDLYKPKMHYRGHLVKQMLRDGFTIDCFAGERTHHRARAISEYVRNTTDFEHSVLMRLYADLPDAADAAFATNLKNRAPANEMCALIGGSQAWLGYALRWQGGEFANGDVVFVDGAVVHVHAAACAKHDESYRYYFIGRPYQRASTITSAASRWTAVQGEDVCFFRIERGNVRLPQLYFFDGVDIVVISHLQLLS